METVATAGLARRNLLQLGAALAVGACAPRSGGLASGVPHFDWTLQPPEAAGMSRAGIEDIRTALQKLVDSNAIVGVVSAAARRNKLVWYEAQGFRDPHSRVPMPRDAIFRVMSSTKPVTAVAVLTMLEEGRLALEDPVSKFIPSFKDMKVAVAPKGATSAEQVTLVPAERQITIKHLLTHTSGITSVGDKVGPGVGALINRIERTPDETLASWTQKLGSAVLDFQPGTKFAYSGTDAPDVALRIVEIVSGQPADVFMRERIFEPADMHDTYFNVPAAKQHRIVDIYGKVNGKWEVKPHLFGPGPYRYFSGGGGLFSTVHDFLNFELMLLNKGSFNGRRVLRPESVELMTRNHIGTLFAEWIPPFTAGHGFGLMVRVVEDPKNINGRTVGAFGWGGAYGTESWAEPALDLAGVLFIQMHPPENGASAAFEKALRAAIVA